MTRNEAIDYVLRRLWLWPLVFWLRPLNMSDRLREAPAIEPATAIIGAGIWGASVGGFIWAWTGDARALWALSLAFAAVATVLAGVSPLASVGDFSRRKTGSAGYPIGAA